MDFTKYLIPKIHNEGYYFIALFAGVSFFLGIFIEPLGWVGAVLTLWCIYFFRDPDRVTPVNDDLVISTADGVVQKIERAKLPTELNMGDEERIRVSIFLSVFNVHVNRVPATGKITNLFYYPGKFLNASLDKASTDNERQLVAMKTKSGKDIAFVQIAGLVARRIVCNIEEGQEVKAGERFGIIRFGSRMDIYLPKDVLPLVVEGQTCVGGETVIADISKASDIRLTGEIR